MTSFNLVQAKRKSTTKRKRRKYIPRYVEIVNFSYQTSGESMPFNAKREISLALRFLSVPPQESFESHFQTEVSKDPF